MNVQWKNLYLYLSLVFTLLRHNFMLKKIYSLKCNQCYDLFMFTEWLMVFEKLIPGYTNFSKSLKVQVLRSIFTLQLGLRFANALSIKTTLKYTVNGI